MTSIVSFFKRQQNKTAFNLSNHLSFNADANRLWTYFKVFGLSESKFEPKLPL